MLRSAIVVMLLSALGATGRMKRTADWELLGSRQVSERVDHEEVVVPPGKGGVRRLKLTVQRAPLELQRVVVLYVSGLPQRIELRVSVPADGETPVIEVDGGTRAIRAVEFWYDATALRGRRSQVRIFGMR
jgi:hypothetical protein